MTSSTSFLVANRNSLSSKFSSISKGILFLIEWEIFIMLECSLCLKTLFNLTVGIT